jgi:hypothetical protein
MELRMIFEVGLLSQTIVFNLSHLTKVPLALVISSRIVGLKPYPVLLAERVLHSEIK